MNNATVQLELIEIKKAIAFIPISNSMKFAIVDDIDSHEVLKHSWNLSGSETSIHTCILHRTISLSKFILGNIYHYEIDHIDKNMFNNTRDNFRFATHSENCANRGVQNNNTLGYKGVTWRKQNSKWVAQISYKGNKKFLGYFFTKNSAAKAYNEASLKYFGEFGYQNKIIQS